MSDIVERLSAQSKLMAKWDWWELGKGPAPAAYDFAVQAEVDRDASAEILRLRAALEAEQWRPIETAPHETAVLLYSPPSYPSAPCMEVAFASSGREWAAPGGGRYSTKSWHGYATHWRPLPSPPDATASSSDPPPVPVPATMTDKQEEGT
jgi:hypothetical protein